MAIINYIPISEIFGPTIQGEGYHLGYPTIFVRVGGCDYNCTWCDTKYAVDPKYSFEWQSMSEFEIMDKIRKLSSEPMLITLSGGNPALYDFSNIIDVGHAEGYTFTAETQGSITKPWFNKLDYITVSPKPPSSGMETDWSELDKCIDYFYDTTKMNIKVVVSDDNDFKYALDVFDRYSNIKKCITPCNINVGNTNVSDICNKTRDVVDMVLNSKHYDIVVLPQLHVLLWGNERGQ